MELEGESLNQGGMRWKGNVHVAMVKDDPGEGKALVAAGHSGVRVNEQKLSRSWSMVTGWRPQVSGGQEEELGKMTWT